ncbi:MAG: manganese efflux pump [Clostridia bacterium]|nr:manganese efflux pump [Clostridia bacterium]MBR3552158.1 manganese efflux pump [Clostridia bacterium]
MLPLILNSLLLGVGLAMDAFSVSVANGLNAPDMPRSRRVLIAGCFAFFQAFMPLLGWVCVHTLVQTFSRLTQFVPWAAFVLLLFIGGKMIWESRSAADPAKEPAALTIPALLVQGVATSLDALSVGFTIADYTLPSAVLCAVLIAAVTFLICIVGLFLGRRIGTKLAGKANILGGVILIAIGAEILLKHLL